MPPAAASSAAVVPARPPPITSTSQWALTASYRHGSATPASRPRPESDELAKPSYSSIVVAASIGSGNGASICTTAQGSSAPAATTPRGRPRPTLLATRRTPLASSAEARVSPAKPV